MTTLDAFAGDLDRILSRLDRRTSFAEVLAETSHGQGVSVDTKSTTVSSRPRMRGAALRAWAGTRWVEAASSDLTLPALEVAADTLEGELEHSSTRSDPPGPSSTVKGESGTHPAQPVSDFGVPAMIELAKAAVGYALEVPSIKECPVRLGWSDVERLYLNTAGARTMQTVTRATWTVAPLAIENGRVELDFDGEGGEGGVELLRSLSEKRVKETAEASRALLNAKPVPTGTMTVLLDPGVAGTFAHESFGHGTEADQFVRDRSYLKPLLGQMVGPDFLTLYDDGSVPGGWGSMYYDDEGNPTQRTVLVDHGKFVSGLHDRETAAALHARPTGNTRRADFLSRPFVRMTNTCVEPGDWALDELVKEAKNGVLMERATSGIEDPLGGQMQLKVKKGRIIRNGELTDIVGSMALSGKVLDFLRATRGVGKKEYFYIDPGYCGKGHSDILPAGTGGSYLLSTAIVGPA